MVFSILLTNDYLNTDRTPFQWGTDEITFQDISGPNQCSMRGAAKSKAPVPLVGTTMEITSGLIHVASIRAAVLSSRNLLILFTDGTRERVGATFISRTSMDGYLQTIRPGVTSQF
jgi:hypothetical protein